eukprot:332651-Ditylum_brightwellii.AAC.1
MAGLWKVQFQHSKCGKIYDVKVQMMTAADQGTDTCNQMISSTTTAASSLGKNSKSSCIVMNKRRANDSQESASKFIVERMHLAIGDMLRMTVFEGNDWQD